MCVQCVSGHFITISHNCFFPLAKLKPGSLTRVEDTGGQRRRKALVQQEFAENHPGGFSWETALQGPQPEVIKVPMETDCHYGHIASVFPVHALLLSHELVHQVTAGE